ncbi:MAG: M20/M25/M40 family metallo-hydrolase [Anaerolineae bacterium]|nr:M20/M25/M40 family metallo-hydrolase [Anaerolineae bacterium]
MNQHAELITLLQTLVQTPSVNGVHPEAAVAEVVARFAQAHGLAVEVVARAAARPNVLVRLGPPGEVGLLLVAHTDTVAPGDEAAWTHPPFSGVIEGDRLYGRGAVDNKGGLVAALAALLLLQTDPPSRPVVLACVPDEEAGATGTLGIKHLNALGKLSGRGAIYTYPGTDELVLGHRGVYRFKLVARGQAVHSGSLAWQQGQGCNAVTGLAELALALEGLRFADGSTDLFAPYRTVVTPTVLRGGAGPSIVPDLAEAYVDVRLTPNVSRQMVEQTVAELVEATTARRPGLRVEVVPDVYLPPTVIPTDAPIVRAVQAAARQWLGRPPVLTVSGPANESYLLNGYGIPTCIFGPEGGNAHAADEYVVLDTLFPVAEVYAEVARWLAEH